jgi:anti-sigma-K factor RskA
MTTELHTLSGAYAIDALSPEEAEEFRKHLAACTACCDEVRELREAAALMGASEASIVPTHLKAKIMAAADRTPQMPPRVRHLRSVPGNKWAPRLLAAAAAVILAVAAGIGYNAMQQPEHVMAAPVAQVFNASDAHQATVKTTNGGEISVATSPSLGKMAVETDDLPDLGSSQVYQLWTLTDGRAASAGLLEDPDAGAAMALPESGTAVAITIEPAGGSDQPTTDPIMSVVPGEV